MRQTFRQERIKHELSILVCSVVGRVNSGLPNIIIELNRQTLGQPVELIWLGDNKSMSVGEKRNLLLYISRGEYVCFVDDDDDVSPNYVATILKNIKSKPDVYCFNVMKHRTYPDGRVINQLMIHAKVNGKNHTEKGVMKMLPNHISVFKRELAMREIFPHINLSEDHKWAEKMAQHIVSEVKTDDVLYYYNDNKGMSETRKR